MEKKLDMKLNEIIFYFFLPKNFKTPKKKVLSFTTPVEIYAYAL